MRVRYLISRPVAQGFSLEKISSLSYSYTKGIKVTFTKGYLITKLTQIMDRKEAMEVFNKACSEAQIENREYEDREYSIHEFIKLANAIKNQGRLARFVGSLAIVEAMASKSGKQLAVNSKV